MTWFQRRNSEGPIRPELSEFGNSGPLRLIEGPDSLRGDRTRRGTMLQFRDDPVILATTWNGFQDGTRFPHKHRGVQTNIVLWEFFQDIIGKGLHNIWT